MFPAKTVFVLGAGASAEVGFPVGSGLLNHIVDMVDFRGDFGPLQHGDQTLYEALRNLSGTTNQPFQYFIDGARVLASVARQHPSIDYTIDTLEDRAVELVGKMAIARAILDFEQRAFQKKRPAGIDTLDLNRFSSTWYNAFRSAVVERRRKSDLDKIFENVAFVNFNYDRSLEDYLPHALAASLNVSLSEARNATAKLVMHRPYGQVGRLPWQTSELPAVEFGYGNWSGLAEVGQLIRTFTEQEQSGASDEIKATLSDARRVVFLGFAFHDQNVELISTRLSPGAEVLASVYGMESDEVNVVRRTIEEAFALQSSGQLFLLGAECAPFFAEYARRLKKPLP